MTTSSLVQELTRRIDAIKDTDTGAPAMRENLRILRAMADNPRHAQAVKDFVLYGHSAESVLVYYHDWAEFAHNLSGASYGDILDAVEGEVALFDICTEEKKPLVAALTLDTMRSHYNSIRPEV